MSNARVGDFSVVTPTGDRPGPFSLCRMYFSRQTLKPKEWIVVDDGKTPMDKKDEFTLVRREPQTTDWNHTLRINIKTAMQHISTNIVVIMEDDDWYSPQYLEFMYKNLQQYDLFGQGRTIYYHVKNREWMANSNEGHSSFCQTGFTRNVFPILNTLYDGKHAALDWDLWATFHGNKKLDLTKPDYCIGIKGLKGRTGTHGHGWVMPNKDGDMAYLKIFIGEDYKIYLDPTL